MRLVYLLSLLMSLSLMACATDPSTPRVEVKGVWQVEGQYSKLP